MGWTEIQAKDAKPGDKICWASSLQNCSHRHTSSAVLSHVQTDPSGKLVMTIGPRVHVYYPESRLFRYDK